jgi:hypothetical protein
MRLPTLPRLFQEKSKRIVFDRHWGQNSSTAGRKKARLRRFTT